MNGIRPLVCAIDYKVPTVDGDYMGRAYPRLYIATPYRKCAVFHVRYPADCLFQSLESLQPHALKLTATAMS